MSERSDRMRERYARAEERNEAIRQKLEPLEPGSGWVVDVTQPPDAIVEDVARRLGR